MNTGMGPTPGTTRASTLSRLSSSSSDNAMSAGAFRSDARAAAFRSSAGTSCSPRYPTTGVTAVCRGTSGQSEDSPRISSRSNSAPDAVARALLTRRLSVGVGCQIRARDAERVERVTNRAGHAVRVSRTHGPRDGRAREPHVRRAEVVRRHGKQHVRRARFLVMAQRHEHRARARNVGSLDARAFPRPEVVRDAPQVVGAQHRAAVRRREAPRFHRQRHRGSSPRTSTARPERQKTSRRTRSLHARRRRGRSPRTNRVARCAPRLDEHVAPARAPTRASLDAAPVACANAPDTFLATAPEVGAQRPEHEEATGRFCLHRTF